MAKDKTKKIPYAAPRVEKVGLVTDLTLLGGSAKGSKKAAMK